MLHAISPASPLFGCGKWTNVDNAQNGKIIPSENDDSTSPPPAREPSLTQLSQALGLMDVPGANTPRPVAPKEDDVASLRRLVEDIECVTASQQADRFHSSPGSPAIQHPNPGQADPLDHLNALAKDVFPGTGTEMKIAHTGSCDQTLNRLAGNLEVMIKMFNATQMDNMDLKNILAEQLKFTNHRTAEQLKTKDRQMAEQLKAKDQQMAEQAEQLKAKDLQIQGLLALSRTGSRKRSRVAAFGNEKMVEFDPDELKASLQRLLVTTPETRPKGARWYPVIALPRSCSRHDSRDYLVNIALLRAALPTGMQNVRLVDIKETLRPNVGANSHMPQEALRLWSCNIQDDTEAKAIARYHIAANLRSGTGDKFMATVKHAFIVLTLDQLKSFVRGTRCDRVPPADMQQVSDYIQDHRGGVLYGVLNVTNRQTQKRKRHNHIHPQGMISQAELPRYENVTEL